jgi:8-oxo-dGTP diphosphatase
MTEGEAAVAILKTREEEESILLMRRAVRAGDSWSGHWSFPGGRRDPADGDLLDTALRELDEECGIRLGRTALETALPPMTARRQALPYLTVSPFVFRVDRRPPTVLNPREAADAAWVRLGLLRDPRSHRLQAVPGRPAHMLFPTVDLEVAPLWGFTYRLITAWLGLEPTCRETAGSEAAAMVLDFLLAEGLALDRGWSGGVASVKGAIPVDSVLKHFSLPGGCPPGINSLEVRADQIRLTALAWEEYRIVGASIDSPHALP